MGFLTRYNGTDILDLGEGYSVTLLRHLPGDAQEAAEAARTRAVANVETSGEQRTVAIETSPDTARYTTLLLSAAIAGWNLTDENDRPLPLSPDEQRTESIRRLPAEVRALLRDKIEANIKAGQRTPEEQKTFRGPGDVGSAVAEGGAAGTPGTSSPGGLLDPARSYGTGTPIVA